jgi:signal transduction histidine kinase
MDRYAATLDGSEAAERRPRAVIRGRNRVVRAVARLPATVHTKLLVAFVGTVVLLVVLGILGLRVLGDSNDRVEALGTLQVRATVYQQLETQAAQIRLLLSVRSGGADLAIMLGGTPASAPGADTLKVIDQSIASTLTRFAQAQDPAHLGFVPTADEQGVLDHVRSDYTDLSGVVTKILGFDEAANTTQGLQLQHDQAEPLSNDLETQMTGLVNSTLDQTNSVIAQNRSSFSSSEQLFIGVAAVSIALALALGYLLSRAVVGPIRAVESRVAAIASGDFSGHVDVPNRDELGSLAANINLMNDELGRLYRDLETASRHKSEFLANMSHELRTPLNAIIGFSEVLSQQMFGEQNAKQLEYLDDITSSGRHLLALINDILDLSKVEAGQMQLQPSEFSVREALESALTMVRERATRQGIELTLDLQLDDDVIEADERKVKQVLFNLLSNAVKFTPPGGHVSVTARTDPDGVRIAVSDSGIGIAAADQTRIFEAFQQVGSGPGGAQEGTGLGLGLARRFVELHGGRIEVQSEVGVGSTFTLTLPARRPVETVA